MARRGRPRKAHRGGAIDPMQAIAMTQQGIDMVKKADAVLKQVKPVTQARNMVQKFMPKAAAKYRAKHPGVTNFMNNLQKQGYGSNAPYGYTASGRVRTKPLTGRGRGRPRKIIL